MRIIIKNKKLLYPLVLLCFFSVFAWFVYQYWHDIFMITVRCQRKLNSEISSMLEHVKDNPYKTGYWLMGVSFIYGILHAIGPGHGKIIISTYLATHSSQLKSSVLLSLFSSLFQGVMAIIVVTVMLVIFKLTSYQLYKTSFLLENSGYILLIVTGLIISMRSIKSIIHFKRALTKHESTDCSGGCCGHQHTPSAQQLMMSDKFFSRLLIVVSIGARPCSGALLILIFSVVTDVFYWGVAAVMLMALGTSFTLCLLAVFVHTAKQSAYQLSEKYLTINRQFYFIHYLALIGGILLILLGSSFYYANNYIEKTNPILFNRLR